MGYDEDFGRLEGFVEKLLARFEEMKREQQTIRAELDALARLNKTLEDEVTRLRDEKKQVRQRLAGLVASIAKWEEAYGEVAGGDQSVAAAPPVGNPEGGDGPRDGLLGP